MVEEMERGPNQEPLALAIQGIARNHWFELLEESPF